MEILDKFDEISDTFFFKTMPSVPAARAVVRDSESALALRQSEEWDEFGTAITTLIASSQNPHREGRDEGSNTHMSARYWLTGGAGSVGRMLVEKLVADGQAVRIFDLPFMDFSGLEDRDGIEIVKGDITDAAQVADAIEGVSFGRASCGAAAAEQRAGPRAHLRRECGGGTENIIKAMEAGAPGRYADIHIVHQHIRQYDGRRAAGARGALAVGYRHIRGQQDCWRADGARVVVELDSDADSGIMVPAFMEPPSPWPFVAEQRVEMVHRDDVVDALFASVNAPEAANKVLNIAAGRLGRCAARITRATSTASWARRSRMWITASRRAGLTGTTRRSRSGCWGIRTGRISTTRMRCGRLSRR